MRFEVTAVGDVLEAPRRTRKRGDVRADIAPELLFGNPVQEGLAQGAASHVPAGSYGAGMVGGELHRTEHTDGPGDVLRDAVVDAVADVDAIIADDAVEALCERAIGAALDLLGEAFIDPDDVVPNGGLDEMEQPGPESDDDQEQTDTEEERRAAEEGTDAAPAPPSAERRFDEAALQAPH